VTPSECANTVKALLTMGAEIPQVRAVFIAVCVALMSINARRLAGAENDAGANSESESQSESHSESESGAVSAAQSAAQSGVQPAAADSGDGAGPSGIITVHSHIDERVKEVDRPRKNSNVRIRRFLLSGDRLVGFDLLVACDFFIVERWLHLLSLGTDTPSLWLGLTESDWTGLSIIGMFLGTWALARFFGRHSPRWGPVQRQGWAIGLVVFAVWLLYLIAGHLSG
jgi:hypothetical protein